MVPYGLGMSALASPAFQLKSMQLRPISSQYFKAQGIIRNRYSQQEYIPDRKGIGKKKKECLCLVYLVLVQT